MRRGAPRPLPQVRRPTAQDHHGQPRSALHAEWGQLDLRPDSPAYATQLRLLSAQVITAANDAVGTQAVRAVRVLAVGAAGPALRETSAAPVPAAGPEVPVKTREMASPGFHQALAAHQSAAPAHRVDPGIAQAVERQNAALRELSRRAFRESDVAPEDAPAPVEAARAQRPRQAAATEAAALAGPVRSGRPGHRAVRRRQYESRHEGYQRGAGA
ncbi:DUF721 domain-containing protein [Streptomyces sp. NPDC001276]|uniref:DUF721 domain-containing protein n=1 Tax=Streptomyces sp. NPDC001276 TaxID=3364555 RepID=UPI00368D9820